MKFALGDHQQIEDKTIFRRTGTWGDTDKSCEWLKRCGTPKGMTSLVKGKRVCIGDSQK